jgi:hypothetical protein
MRFARLIGLYPGWWRRRYGLEMGAVLDAGPLRTHDAFDLVRGALDAWLHPAARSRLPAAAALVGGGLWTAVAAAVVVQPVPADWPGYLVEVVPLALVAASLLMVATLGCALRAGDGAGPMMAVAAGATVVGYLAWLAALATTAAGMADAPILAAAQTLAMVGTIGIGVALVRAGDGRVGTIVVAAAVAMLVPWTATWLAFGAAWTAVGIILELERPSRADLIIGG